MAAHFNQLSLIGVVANLAVGPPAAVATTLGVGAVLVELLPGPGGPLLFDCVWLVLLILRALVALAAALPGAMVHLPAPMLAASLAWYAALLLAPGVAGSRRRRALLGLLPAHRRAIVGVALARPHRSYPPAALPPPGPT